MSLPEWRVQPVYIKVAKVGGGWKKEVKCLKITCPRSDCGRVAYVSKEWADRRVIAENTVTGELVVAQTRACTYCFKANNVPAR